MKSASHNNHVFERNGKLPRTVFVWAILLVSLLPLTLEIASNDEKLSTASIASTVNIPVVGSALSAAANWVRVNDGSVQELRPLASFPTDWQGSWFEVDKNYSRFERWFSDNLGLRSLMIRTKNELDYRLFRSSTRVYFGKGLDIFGRNLIDNELPATELLLAKPENVDAITRGAVKLTAQLKDEGTTAIWVVPMMKEYFNPNRLPFFAPRLAIPSNFQTLYGSLKKQPDLHFVDVFQIIESLKGKYPIFHQQDFHWTDMSAMAVASDTVNTIARLSESKTRWEHPMEVIYEPQIGSDARFSARLNEEGIPAPVLKKTWQDRHTFASLDPKTTGLEFETNAIDDPDLLPPTCMYGNSFGDGMLRAGMTDYFKKFTKFDRALPLSAIPDLARGRCKYMVIQILDLSSGLWASLRK